MPEPSIALTVRLPVSLKERIEDYWFRERFRNQHAAILALLEQGLQKVSSEKVGE